MKKLWLISLGLLLSCNASQRTSDVANTPKSNYDPLPYAATILESDLKEMLFTFASDSFQGRNTGSPGQKMAANYIKERYKALLIPSAKSNGDYFQKVPLQGSRLPNVSLQINGTEYTIEEDFVTYEGPDYLTAEFSKIIYAGYGIETDNYSDYENLDVTGKVVLIKAGEPKKKDGTYVLSGTKKTTSKWSNIRKAFDSKIYLAKEKGAAGILFYDADNFKVLASQYSYRKNRNYGRIRLSKTDKNPFFYFFINGEIANSLYSEINSKSSQKALSAKLKAVFNGSEKPIDSENVIAWIKGSEKPDEYIVISAHLDHEGVKNGKIYNGADDDGSGTVAVLEIAEAFQKAAKDGNGPKRSVVFLHVTAEEKGLFGSEYYTKNPIFPLENTVANLNTDMIGRVDEKREGSRNYVYLIGSDRISTELHTISEEMNTKYTQLVLDYKYNDRKDRLRLYYRSDHYNFAKNNIPVIFYFNGLHKDYHKPTDTPDRIEYDLLAKRAKLIFHTAWELANRENRLVLDKLTQTN